MTTPMTPTQGAPLRPGRPAPADVDRWLPDPSWPVPPRGWQLWAAAGAPTRTLRDERSRGGDGGTSAGGRNGPELTHVGSRRTLAAGTLPMSRGNLAAWIVDPLGIKPGVNMPLVKLDPDQLNSISAYLEGLK